MINFTMLAHNRPRLTYQTLKSMGPMEGATVTVLNHNSDEETSHIIDMFCLGREGWFSSWSDEDIGTGPLRNMVIEMSAKRFGRGEYIYISDNDCYFLQPDWLSVMKTVCDEAHAHGFRAVGCYGHPFNRPCSPAVRLDCRWSVNEVYALASQSMMLTWDTFDTFGPFCDTPAGKVCQSEDVDFSNRIREAGFKVGVISPPLLVNTGITNSFGEHIPGWELVKSQCPQGVICE